MIKLYGLALSFPVNKVRFVLNYLNIDYDFIKVNLPAGEHQREEYLKINPVGKVPAITDGEFSMGESNAIIRYLASKHSSEIYPQELRQRAFIEQQLDFIGMHIHSAVVKVAFNRLFAKHVLKIEPNEKEIEEGLNFLDRFLAVIDKQLESSDYVAGEKLSLADFALLACLDPAEAAGFDSIVNKYSKISKWRHQLKQEEFYTKCHKNFEDNLLALKS